MPKKSGTSTSPARPSAAAAAAVPKMLRDWSLRISDVQQQLESAEPTALARIRRSLGAQLEAISGEIRGAIG